jgi:hypothetical protein
MAALTSPRLYFTLALFGAGCAADGAGGGLYGDGLDTWAGSDAVGGGGGGGDPDSAASADVDAPLEDTTTGLQDAADAQPTETEDAASGQDGSPPPGPDVLGIVTVRQVQGDIDALSGGYVEAWFGPAPKVGPPVETYGSCDVVPVAAFDSAYASSPWDAGPVSVHGIDVPIELARSEVEPDVWRYVTSPTRLPEALLPSEGEPLQISAEGGADVMPFEGSVTSPALIARQSPPMGPKTSLTLTQDLEITWNGGTDATRVVARIAGAAWDGVPLEGHALSCTLDTDTGSLVVSADALGAIPASFGTNVVISLTRIHETAVPAGPGVVLLRASHTQVGMSKAY